MTVKGISQFFDLTVRDQVEAQILNGGGDNFFLFSGPPSFNKITTGLAKATGGDLEGVQSDGSEADPWLCPLLFTSSFSDPDYRPPDGQLGSFGTQKTIAAPSFSNPAPRSIMVGSMALVTAHPKRGKLSAEQQQEQWNMLKRLYYWMIQNRENYPEIEAVFATDKGYIGNEKNFPQAIAPQIEMAFGNFARSSFYKIPIGIMAVALNKSAEPLSVRYYEGVTIQGVGPQLQAGLNQPIMLSGNSTNMQMTYTEVNTFTKEQAKNLVGTADNAEQLIYNVISKFID